LPTEPQNANFTNRYKKNRKTLEPPFKNIDAILRSNEERLPPQRRAGDGSLRGKRGFCRKRMAQAIGAKLKSEK